MSPELTLHPGMSNEDYHALDAVSPSRLKLLARSPLHYFDRYLAVDREPQKSTINMQLGTALHTAVLEPHLFDSTVMAAPDDAPNRPTEKQLTEPTAKPGTKAHDEWKRACDRRDYWQAFDLQSAGKLIFSQAEFDRVRAMAAAVRAHPAASFVLSMEGAREHSYTWREAPINCKTRPDFHTLDRKFVVDVKSTADASRDPFSKSISNFDYHVQTAWNLGALDAETFLTIAVENTRPYAVAVYPAAAELVEAGHRRIQAAMETLADCITSGKWPGYGDHVQEPIELPHWNKD